jgi:nitrogen fixation/metabolism regulation signal transduction histidine kinase
VLRAKTCVNVQVEGLGDKARIGGEDDGPGFSSETHGERPERGMPGQSEPGSSGLGLGIVEDILAEYGTSAKIKGNGRCRIVFGIPLCRPEQVQNASNSVMQTSS